MLLHSPAGSAIGAVQPLPEDVTPEEGGLSLAAGLAERLALQAGDPVILTPPQQEARTAHVRHISVPEDKIANRSVISLPERLVQSACPPSSP